MLCAITAFAQNDSEQEFKQRLEAVSASNKTIQCDFTQEKKVKNLKNLINSEGDFYYDNSGAMALIYTQPEGDKIIMNNTDFEIVSGGKTIKTDAKSNPAMTQVSYMMQACMSGDVSKLGRGWNMKIVESESEYNITLTPTDRRIKKYISAINMVFDKKDVTLNTLQMNETSGGYTHYQFFNKKINSNFDHSVFNAQ